MTNKKSSFSWIVCLGYVFLLTYFNFFDAYHQHFFSSGITVIFYHIARIAFILYLIWIVYATGNYLLRRMAFQSFSHAAALDTFILAFFTGTGLISSILFVIGLIGFYNRHLVDVVTVTILVLSRQHLDYCMTELWAQRYKYYWPGLLLVALPLFLLLTIKGLYPAGGHDYFNHYFHFYRYVADTGKTLPNDVWYHFYYSKGASLFFLSILLTDMLGPQLATMAMVIVGSLLVFSILKNKSTWAIFPWVGSALYIVMMIYTPGPQENLAQGGWGDFEKLHEIVAVLMLLIVWISINMSRSKIQLRAPGLTLLFATVALVLTTPVMAVISAIFMIMISLYFVASRNYSATMWFVIATILAGLTLTTLWILNYYFTGLPDDQNLFVFWPIVDFDKIIAWGVLWELIIAHWNKTQLALQQLPLSKNYIFNIATYLRLDVWWPLFITSLLLFSASLTYKRTREYVINNIDTAAIIACGGFLLIIAILSIFIGRGQPFSFYRFATFSYAPMLCLCMLLLSPFMHRWAMRISVIAIIASFTWLDTTEYVSQSLMGKTMLAEYKYSSASQVFTNSMKFLTGRYSIADAYKNQQGWPGRLPWGGIYSGAQKVWELLPPKTRVWSMHVHSYCMLPDCRFESYMSYRFSKDAGIVYFGKPSLAKKSLKNENLNYFFIAKSLQLTDPLPLSPLFSPSNIANYLGIVWTDGDNTLLTWKEQSNYPIDPAWLLSYKKTVNESKMLHHFPYDAIKKVMNGLEKNHQFSQTEIPWVINSHSNGHIIKTNNG